jgi:hypothetical protein
MTALFARLNAPLVVFDSTTWRRNLSALFIFDRRRWINREKRDLFRREGIDAHSGGPVEMTTEPHTEKVEPLAVIGFFKLVTIVAVPMAFLLTPLLLIINGRTDTQVDKAVQSVLRETDSRYVRSEIYRIEHEEIVGKVRDGKVHDDTQEIRLAKMEMQLQQIQMTLETVRSNQNQKGNGAR